MACLSDISSVFMVNINEGICAYNLCVLVAGNFLIQFTDIDKFAALYDIYSNSGLGYNVFRQKK